MSSSLREISSSRVAINATNAPVAATIAVPNNTYGFRAITAFRAACALVTNFVVVAKPLKAFITSCTIKATFRVNIAEPIAAIPTPIPFMIPSSSPLLKALIKAFTFCMILSIICWKFAPNFS